MPTNHKNAKKQNGVSTSQRKALPTHQGLVDIDGLMEDCPHDRLVASGCGQGALVAVELCKIHIPNQFHHRKVCINGHVSV